jgi:hypothetical protein
MDALARLRDRRGEADFPKENLSRRSANLNGLENGLKESLLRPYLLLTGVSQLSPSSMRDIEDIDSKDASEKEAS